MSKKFLFFIVLFHLISSNNFVLSEIIPLKKPTQSKEVTQKKLLIDILKPLPKPIKKTETKKTEEKVVVKKEKKNWHNFTKKKAINSWDYQKNRC